MFATSTVLNNNLIDPITFDLWHVLNNISNHLNSCQLSHFTYCKTYVNKEEGREVITCRPLYLYKSSPKTVNFTETR